MMVEPIWWEYAIFDDDGLAGIRKDAPEEMKKAYREYLQSLTTESGKNKKL